MWQRQGQPVNEFGAPVHLRFTTKRRTLPLILLAGFVLLVLGVAKQGEIAATQGAISGEGACIGWDISGEWQYRASLGGYGTMTFVQDAAGKLTGGWHNAATGGSGSLTGEIQGAAVHFIPSAEEAMMGTVSPEGTKIIGTFTYGQQFGTWEATGSADCIRRQPAPALGTAQINVRWGPHLYRRALRAGGGSVATPVTNQPQPPPGVPVITFLGQTTLEVEVIYYGDNLPNTLPVFVRVENQDYASSSLVRSGETADGGVIYRGRVSVAPRGPIAPGQREVQDVMFVDPWGNNVFVARIDMNLIDPSGYIYDAQTNERLEGAVVTCYVRQNNRWLLWDAGMYGQENPLVSNDMGHYGWEVPQGAYKVLVSKSCYQDAESEVVNVPPPRTDVHFGLQPLACSPLTIADIWTADSADIPALDFRPGQEVNMHVIVSNTSAKDASMTLTWSVRDPDGAVVADLSGSSDYIVQPGNAVDVKVGGVLPAKVQEGAFTLMSQLTYDQQTSTQVTQFQVVSGATVNLPLILGNYHGTQIREGITGRVTEKGHAAAAVPLSLRHFNGNAWSTAATTKTDPNGAYRFNGIDALGQNEVYYVLFGPNDTDPARLYVWFGHDITAYTGRSEVAGGDFDISDVLLLAPDPGVSVPLPVTFTWQRRGVSGDGYRMILFDLESDDAWTSGDLGNSSSVTISSLSPDMSAGKPYGWYVEVYSGPDSYGKSFYYQEITFAGSGQGVSKDGELERLHRVDRPIRSPAKR